MRTVQVPLGDRTYDVVVGHGAVGELARLLPTGARRVALVTQPGIPLVDAVTTAAVGDSEVVVTEIGDGEANKDLATVERLCRRWAQAGITRGDVVVGVGGGLVTDVAGFAASAYHRGMPVVHVATSLLAMVDAAIGGKTGVNLPEGKNLVGAFWQPSGVVCDLDALATLPERELRCGHGEMAKYHFLTGDDLLAMDLEARVATSVATKAEVVASDEREGGRRAILNYGHTLAHALEVAGDFALRHGEAVAIGLIYAAHLGRALGRIDDARVARHYEVVRSYGLDVGLPAGSDRAELIALMARDKKALDGFTFALDGPRGVEVVPDVARPALEAAFDAMDAHGTGTVVPNPTGAGQHDDPSPTRGG